MKIKSPAKINLAINVLERLPNGYHILDMVATRISLFDEITIDKRSDDKITITSNSDNIPLDSSNDAYKAAALMMSHFKIKHGYDIHIEKNTPIAAGLGGGSSNAASVIKAIVDLENIQTDVDTLKNIAIKIGTDVVLFMEEGLVRIEGIGDIVTPLGISYNRELLLIKPKFSVSTKAVYEALTIDNAEKTDMNQLIQSIENNAYVEAYMSNALESVTEKMHPEIVDIKAKLLEHGAVFSMMSGSGPSVFAVFEDMDKREKAFEYFNNQCYDVFKIKTI